MIRDLAEQRSYLEIRVDAVSAVNTTIESKLTDPGAPALEFLGNLLVRQRLRARLSGSLSLGDAGLEPSDTRKQSISKPHRPDSTIACPIDQPSGYSARRAS